MNQKISLPPDAIARQEMLKKRQAESKPVGDSGQPLDAKKPNESAHASKSSVD